MDQQNTSYKKVPQKTKVALTQATVQTVPQESNDVPSKEPDKANIIQKQFGYQKKQVQPKKSTNSVRPHRHHIYSPIPAPLAITGIATNDNFTSNDSKGGPSSISYNQDIAAAINNNFNSDVVELTLSNRHTPRQPNSITKRVVNNDYRGVSKLKNPTQNKNNRSDSDSSNVQYPLSSLPLESRNPQTSGAPKATKGTPSLEESLERQVEGVTASAIGNTHPGRLNGFRSLNDKVITAKLADNFEEILQEETHGGNLLDQIFQQELKEPVLVTTRSPQKRINFGPFQKSPSSKNSPIATKQLISCNLLNKNINHNVVHKWKKNDLSHIFHAEELKRQLALLEKNILLAEINKKNTNLNIINTNKIDDKTQLQRLLDKFIGLNKKVAATDVPGHQFISQTSQNNQTEHIKQDTDIIQSQTTQLQMAKRVLPTADLEATAKNIIRKNIIKNQLYQKNLENPMPYHDTFSILRKLTQNQYMMGWTDAKDCKRLSSIIAENFYDNLVNTTKKSLKNHKIRTLTPDIAVK